MFHIANKVYRLSVPCKVRKERFVIHNARFRLEMS